MTYPHATLLLFALWTILVPLGAVGFYRFSLIFAGKEPIHAFRADAVQGADWYRRAMRAHANCVENLPVYGAIVFVLTQRSLASALIDVLCVVLIVSRVSQSLVHMSFVETERSVSVRFSFFLAQLLCMLALGVIALRG